MPHMIPAAEAVAIIDAEIGYYEVVRDRTLAKVTEQFSGEHLAALQLLIGEPFDEAIQRMRERRAQYTADGDGCR